MTSQPAPTRQAVLISYAEQYRLRTGLSHERWAERVDREYCQRVPMRLRNVPAPDLESVEGADEWAKLRRAWDQTLRRYVDGGLKFPVELEEAWVGALEDPWRSDCIRELAERYGLYGAFRRPATAEGDSTSWGTVLRDFARVTEDMAQILADGRIDERDGPELHRLRDDIRRMQGDLESLERQASRVLGKPQLREVGGG